MTFYCVMCLPVESIICINPNKMSPMIEVITPKCLPTSLHLLLPRAKGKRKKKEIKPGKSTINIIPKNVKEQTQPNIALYLFLD